MGKYIYNVQMCGCADAWILLTNWVRVCKSVYILNMKFRAARHTTDLKPIIRFYKDILGLEVIGQFENHDGYDGVFLGDRNAGWHLEFTTGTDAPEHSFDEDDLLVFYPGSLDEYNSVVGRLNANNIKYRAPKNPYWKHNGIMIHDPDGFGVMIVMP